MAQETKPIRPLYGAGFRCIGPACEDTCCHGWSVPVDKATYEKYQAFPEGGLRALTQQHLSRNTVDATDSLFAQINLTPTKDCPFLATDRLCAVQKEYGPEYLSATCSIYPRVLNSVEGELEMSLYLSCPEAARGVLLDPQFAEKEGADSAGYFRTDQFSMLASDGNGSIHKPYGYFREVRQCIVALLRDRSRPLWQRLFLLGMLCRRLDEIITAEQDYTVPGILNDYLEMVATGALRNEIESVPGNPAVQLDVVLRLADRRIRAGGNGERFQECFRAFIQGIGYRPDSTTAGYVSHFLEAEAKYYRPFCETNPFIMENYLLNYVFRTLFPFGRQASAHFTPQNIFGEFVLLATQFAVIDGLLIGMAGHYREAFGSDHVITLIQSFSKAVEHNPTYLKEMSDFVRGRNLTDNRGIAILLKR